MKKHANDGIDRYRVDIFDELSDSALAEINKLGVKRLYSDHQFVQRRGDQAHHAFVLLSGRIRCSAHMPNGTERFIRWMEPGEVAGLSSVLAGVPVPVDLVAKGACQVLILPGEALLKLLARDPQVGIVLTRALSLRVSELFDVVFTRSSQTLAERVWATIERLTSENGELMGNGSRVLRISQTQLAQAVGASRQRVNDELLRLQAQKKLKLGYRKLEIPPVDQSRLGLRDTHWQTGPAVDKV